MFFVPCSLWFPRNNDVFTPICFVKDSNLTCYLYLLTVTFFQHYFYVRWCSWPLAGTRWDPPVEQKLHTLPEHLKQPRVFMLGSFANFVRFFVLFCKSLFVLFSYVLCIVCSSSIYGFWLPYWNLQTVLVMFHTTIKLTDTD